jgi:hypothetical protein
MNKFTLHFCWIALAGWLGSAANAAVVYSQPPNPAGGLLQSSWWAPDGSDYDQYVWDGFVFNADQSITEVRWRGGHDPSKGGIGGPVIEFTVAIYGSIPGGSQPSVGNPPLVEYHTGDAAGETAAGNFGGVAMNDYGFILPQAFAAVAGTKYWIQIEATQHGIPDWGISSASAGDGKYYRRIYNAGDAFFQSVNGDAAFLLFAPGQPALTINRGTNSLQVVLSWPTSATNYLADYTTNLIAPVLWTALTNAPTVIDGAFQLIMPAADPQQFFRLRKP